MTSTVTNYSNQIDTGYPVAGIDNDTQGFRDNFVAIQRAFTATSIEITALQIAVSSASTTSTEFAQSITDDVTANVFSYLADSWSTSTAVSYRLGAPTDATGAPGDLKGMIYANSTTIYVCYSSWTAPGTDAIWSKVNVTAW